MHRKAKCSVCGNYTDIVAKVTSDPNILYCKDCRDEEVQRLGRNFDLIKFVCIRCGSTNVKKDDLRTGINEDVISVNNSTTDYLISVYAVRSEENTSELQSIMRNSYAVFCLK